MAKAPAEIRSLARAHTNGALKVLHGIMSKEDAPEAARITAAIALLDRGWGKPKQSMDVEHSGSVSLNNILAEIDGGSKGLQGSES